MKKMLLTLGLAIAILQTFAQRAQFDFVHYTPPSGWQKIEKPSVITYIYVDPKDKSWCRISLYKSIASAGSITADFDAAWKELVAGPLQVSGGPQGTTSQEADGWSIQSAGGPYLFEGANAIALLTAFTGYGRTIDILATTNAQRYLEPIETFIGSLDFDKPIATPPANTPPPNTLPTNATDPANAADPSTSASQGSRSVSGSATNSKSKSNSASSTNSTLSANSKSAGNPPSSGNPTTPGNTTSPGNSAPAGRFSFTTTHFDDGWTSTVQENWVAVEKGNLKVMIHYPGEAEKKYYSNTDEELRLFWNLLVAPRYSSLRNFRVSFPSSYEPGKIAAGTVTDKATGKSQYVALFKKGTSNWMEFIAPDQQRFIQAFGIDIDHLDAFFTAWDPLVRMGGYNKFAVAAADLTGTWCSSFTGVTQYVYANTGNSAGMDTHSSSQTFEFHSGQSYNWSISAANGFVGNIKFQSAKSAGKFSVPTNWTISCSEIEGKPKTYNAYFSCIKGARILWLEDQSYAQGYTAFGKVE